MELPKNDKDWSAFLKGITTSNTKREGFSGPTVLNEEDEAYLKKLVKAIRDGKRAVIVVEDSDDKLKYMLSNASRAESLSMMGKVIEAVARKLASGGDSV